jgi:hypothetical protein
MMATILSQEQIQCFQRDGVLVISNLFSYKEIQSLRSSFHQTLLEDYQVNIDDLAATAANLRRLSSTGGAGGILDHFISDWKLNLHQDERIFAIYSQLWQHTWANPNPTSSYQHPFGGFNPRQGYIYLDRLCFRLPELYSRPIGCLSKKHAIQRSLTPHLDCCPDSLFDNPNKEYPKWRPIQGFLALTDSLHPNEGGFEACLGHHLSFDTWARARRPSPGMTHAPCVGEFSPIRPGEDQEILDRFQAIPCKAGDLVCWDYRIPHANARYNNAAYPREVVYLSYLPAIDRNHSFAFEQLRRYRAGLSPIDMWIEEPALEATTISYGFSELGRKLMAIDPWELS